MQTAWAPRTSPPVPGLPDSCCSSCFSRQNTAFLPGERPPVRGRGAPPDPQGSCRGKGFRLQRKHEHTCTSFEVERGFNATAGLTEILSRTQTEYRKPLLTPEVSLHPLAGSPISPLRSVQAGAGERRVTEGPCAFCKHTPPSLPVVGT